MRLNLFKQPNPEENHIDIYYSEMTRNLRHIITIIEHGVPRLEGRSEGETVLVALPDVLYFDTVDRRTYLYLKQDIYSSDLTLSEFIHTFGEYGFARINKSQIVNLNRVNSIRPTAGMRILAVLENGEKLVINRSYRDSFEAAIKAMGRKHHEEMDI